MQSQIYSRYTEQLLRLELSVRPNGARADGSPLLMHSLPVLMLSLLPNQAMFCAPCSAWTKDSAQMGPELKAMNGRTLAFWTGAHHSGEHRCTDCWSTHSAAARTCSQDPGS